MKAVVFDGKCLAEKIKLSIRRKIKKLKLKPLIVSIRAGASPASETYVTRQEKSCIAAGIKYRKIKFPENVSEKTILKKIQTLNDDAKVTGIIVLLPLPVKINTLTVHKSIKPEKDIEGVNPDNTGLLSRGKAIMPPCTAAAVMKILKSIKCSAEGKNAVIVGCSDIVGKPLAMMLMRESATVTVCNIKTKNLSSHTQKADILIAAAGVKNLIKPSMIKRGAIVIDVGFNAAPKLKAHRGMTADARAAKNGICGDVCFKAVLKKASFITPVPGGVGPVTAYQLLLNAVNAAANKK